MLCYAMLCYVMLCYAMLCYPMLCFAMLCYAILSYYVSRSFNPCRWSSEATNLGSGQDHAGGVDVVFDSCSWRAQSLGLVAQWIRKASAYGAGDCRFQSCRDHRFFLCTSAYLSSNEPPLISSESYFQIRNYSVCR